MTVSTEVDHNDYTGNGVTTSFPYTFRIFKKSDLVVQVVDLNENITKLILDADYTVTGAGGYTGGNVILVTALADGYQISISRELPVTQETDLRNQGKFFAEVHEDAFDKLTMLIQQVRSFFSLALRKPSFVANYYDALNNYIRNLRDPSRPQDAATKNYVDTLASTNLSRTLRVPEVIPQLPDAATRANKMPAFDSSGNPIVVLPPSGSASDVLIELAKPTGSALVGYKWRQNASAASRTVQDKLDDFVFLEDFGGKDDSGTTDNSIAFQKAFASGARKIHLKGSGIYGMKTRDIELPAKYEIIGNAKNPEIKYLGSDSTFTMFTLTGSGPAASQWKQGGIFRDVIISSDTVINWMVCRHVQNLEFDRVFFYNAQTVMNNFHYVNFFRCERWGSPFIGRADLNTVEFISEAPKFLMCFSSNSPIDVWDTADLFISECSMFAGDFAVRTRTTLGGMGGTDQFAGFPVLISNSVFDSINGNAFDMESLAYATINGNFISAGRPNNARGINIKGARNLTFTGNTITYCGDFGMVLENAEQCSLSNNIYNGNKTGGLSLVNCKEISVIGGAMGTSYISGGYYVQPLGITDPADNCNSITINGVSFDSDMTTKIYLNTSEERKNRIIACLGVNDTQTTYQNRGSTAQRPTAPVSGQMYYDTTLGLPIWYNTVSSEWKRADGTSV
ncbi:right-handed parallel beta-helix repeat-containing protein [Escherichia coli]